MRIFQLGLPVMALVLAVAANAFEGNPQKTTDDPEEFHWFNPNDQYAGKMTRQQADNLCPGDNQICLTPYSSITGSAGNEQPVGNPAGDPVLKQ